MDTFAKIIDAFGGPAKFGRAVGISTERAAEQRARNSIAPMHWPRVVEAAAEAGIAISADDLVRIYAGRRERAAS